MPTTSTKISELVTLSTMTDIAYMPVVEGLATKRITGLNLKTYVLNGTINPSVLNITTTTNATSTQTGGLTVAGGAGIGRDLYVGGFGRFNGAYNEVASTSTVALYLGVGGDAPVSPRIGFANSGTTWQIDNYNGTFRWYIPGSTRMEISTAGNLTVTSGNVYLASGKALLVGGNQQTNGPAFSAYTSSTVTQTIPSGISQTKVLFQVEEYDTNNNFASSRFTPTVAGYYQFNATVRLDGASGTGENMIVLWKNGAEYKRGWNSSGVQFASSFWSMSVSTVAYANGTGDYFEIYVQQGSASSVTVTVAGANITYFNGCMVRGA